MWKDTSWMVNLKLGKGVQGFKKDVAIDKASWQITFQRYNEISTYLTNQLDQIT